MAELYFYEHMSLGRWWPRTEPQEPQRRTSEGRRVKIRGVIKVDAHFAHLPLGALREVYSIDGRFKGSYGPEHLRRVQEANR
jgi:hypothetical protein